MRCPSREWYEEFHPYGTTAWWAGDSEAEVSLKRYRYTGKEMDEETGLYYHGARYYAPWIGRWTGADPIGLGDGVNRFGYCRACPTAYRDLTGLAAAKVAVNLRVGSTVVDDVSAPNQWATREKLVAEDVLPDVITSRTVPNLHLKIDYKVGWFEHKTTPTGADETILHDVSYTAKVTVSPHVYYATDPSGAPESGYGYGSTVKEHEEGLHVAKYLRDISKSGIKAILQGRATISTPDPGKYPGAPSPVLSLTVPDPGLTDTVVLSGRLDEANIRAMMDAYSDELTTWVTQVIALSNAAFSHEPSYPDAAENAYQSMNPPVLRPVPNPPEQPK